MLDFANTNTFLNSIQYSQNNDEKRMKGGFPMNKYGDQDMNHNDNKIIYGGDNSPFQTQDELNKIEEGSFFVPLGLVYFPPPLCDYDNDHNKNNHILSEDIPVISDKHFESLFALVSSNQKKSNRILSSSRKLNRRNPFKKTKKNK